MKFGEVTISLNSGSFCCYSLQNFLCSVSYLKENPKWHRGGYCKIWGISWSYKRLSDSREGLSSV